MLSKLTHLWIFTILLNFASFAQDTNKTHPFPLDFRGTHHVIENFDAEISVKKDGGFHLLIRTLHDNGEPSFKVQGAYQFILNKDTISLDFVAGKAVHHISAPPGLVLISYNPKLDKPDGTAGIETIHKLYNFEQGATPITQSHIPLWWSIIPPLLTIVLALILREVIISLVAGIWLGSFIIYGFRPERILDSLFRVMDHYLIQSVANPEHVMILVFSFLIGGMVAIISRNGGMAGIVQRLSKYADSSKNTKVITWILGLAIFFDDYANTLIVGNTMRPVTDRFRISREKLAYIVDSTAAPVAAIALVTTWIGAELLYIGQETQALGIEESAYSIFLNSLKYSFYPVLTLIFVLMLILMNRDYGGMYKAESRARSTGALFDSKNNMKEGPVDNSLKTLDPVVGIKYRSINAILPILTVIIVTFTGLIVTGYSSETWSGNEGFFTKLSETIGQADSYISLIWGSFLGVFTAIVLSLATKTLSFRYSIESMMDGFKTMLPALVILILAWSLADITKDLHTADFLTGIFSGNIAPQYLPLLTFILAAGISFSTGSSWGTMAILYPLILPTTYLLSVDAGLPEAETMTIMYNVTAAVLGGSVLGDHSSPISDTTILSSLATGCNHIDHVRTQLPYALTVGVVSALVGGWFYLLGLPWWLNYLIGAAALFAIIRIVGKKVPVSFLNKEADNTIKMDNQ